MRYTSPLEWRKTFGTDEDGDVSYSAGTAFGDYVVERRDGRWLWRYCFDEYYDEGESGCENLKDGKASAQTHWDERVQEILASRLRAAP